MHDGRGQDSYAQPPWKNAMRKRSAKNVARFFMANCPTDKTANTTSCIGSHRSTPIFLPGGRNRKGTQAALGGGQIQAATAEAKLLLSEHRMREEAHRSSATEALR